ncbi:MAG: hypothetical protein GF341_04110, partial [candidate division Zixibacteria bacterium]|nr:hypothetical protein [candidate division Zixibacteria bacterium]
MSEVCAPVQMLHFGVGGAAADFDNTARSRIALPCPTLHISSLTLSPHTDDSTRRRCMTAEHRVIPGRSRVVRVAMWAVAITVLMTATSGFAFDATELAPYRHGGSVNAYFDNITYDAAIPTPVSVLGFDLGSRPVRYHEMVTYLQAVADASPRVIMTPFGRTHEGRALYYLTIGTPENVQNAERLREDIAQLANGMQTGVEGAVEANHIIGNSPAIAWLGYSIHGDELSGVDAACWVTYQLAARSDPEITTILDSVLILIDPTENPDGRERYLAQVFSMAGVVPNTDAQSLSHGGVWPYGRSNHYLFDLNRDWLPLVHPESQARADLILHWNPQMVVDAHEMGAYSTY